MVPGERPYRLLPPTGVDSPAMAQALSAYRLPPTAYRLPEHGAAQTGEQIVLLVGRGHARLGATEALDAEVILSQVVGQEQKWTVSLDLRAVGAQGIELTLHVRVYVDQGRHHLIGCAPLRGL